MNQEAFENAVMAHKDRVNAYASLMLRDTGEAQDVAQEALIRLWENRDKIGIHGARPWLMRTTHNLCIDRIRRRRVRSEVDDGETVMLTQADSTPGPRQLAESDQVGRLIQEALAALSPGDQAVVVMREIQGLPYDEIATALNVPLGTLKARLHRARDRLRSRLTRAGVSHEPYRRESRNAL